MFRGNRIATAAGLFVLAATTACGGDPEAGAADSADEAAERLCRGPGLEHATAYDSESELVASHPTTAGELRRWERDRHTPHGPAPHAELRAASPDSFVAVCEYAGDYVGFPEGPPTEADPEPDPYRYLTVTVTEEPTDSHPVGASDEPEPVLNYSVSPDHHPKDPPRPHEEGS